MQAGGPTLRPTKPDHWYDRFVFMDTDTRIDFETFATTKEFTEASLARMRSYIRQHGRLRVLNAVKEVMPDDLDLIMGVKNKRPKR